MQTNLAQTYVKFIDNGGNLEQLVQELIDRAQYHEGAIAVLNQITKVYEAPFEVVDTDQGRIRKLKESFQKNEQNESIQTNT